LWLALLPLALWEDLGWLSIGANVIIAYLLLGIEEIGVQIEEVWDLLLGMEERSKRCRTSHG
jgi:predicted membrane chloride channel (bestrophin family)